MSSKASHLMKNHYVRTILLSRIALQCGIWIRNFAILLYVTDVTNRDPYAISLISVVEFAPIFIFALIGGAFADRWLPKRTMIGSDIGSSLAIVAVIIATQSFGAWWLLLVATFVSASLSQFSQPSALKIYKQHVPAEQLQSVMALSQSLVAIFTVLGPVIGTFLYLQFGITISLIITFACFVGSALILGLLPSDVSENESTNDLNRSSSSVWIEMLEGICYVKNSPALRSLSAAFAASGLAAGLIQPLALFIVVEKLQLDKSHLQWFMMVNGAAMLIGGAAVLMLSRKISPQILLAIGLCVSAFCTLGVGMSTVIWVTFLLQFISGLFYPCIQIGIQTLLMRHTAAAFIGRVGGAITPIFMGMMVLGMSSAAWFMKQTSLLSVYMASSVLLVIGAIMLYPLVTKQMKGGVSLDS